MNTYDYDEYDECDVFCSCTKCSARNEREKKDEELRRYKEQLNAYGFKENEDLPLEEYDKQIYYFRHSYYKKKILSIKHETEKAILVEFRNFDKWIPKSVLFNNIEKIRKENTIELEKWFNI